MCRPGRPHEDRPRVRAALQGEPLRSLKGISPCWRTAHADVPIGSHPRDTCRSRDPHIPSARTLKRQWLAFRYPEGSAWQVPGREGKWLIVRTSGEDARLHQYGPDREWLAVTDANVFDSTPWEDQ